MADNDQLLEQIKKVVREENEPLKEGQKRLEQGLADVKQSQTQTNTALEALKAGQEDIREKMATKADIHDLRADLVKKVKSHESRFENLEKHAGIPNPHKN